MEWVEPHHKRERVNIAGANLVAAINDDWQEWSPEKWDRYSEDLEIINNWRASHAYPLLVMRNDTWAITAKKVDPDALVAQRIKRLVSIGAKLDRERRMKLSQMQDIGGCRSVVGSVGRLMSLKKLYDQSSLKHDLASFDNYVNKPRSSGYRGLHFVYRYKSDKIPKMIYNGSKIELQLRSQYQHA